jgi:hypothetical protein
MKKGVQSVMYCPCGQQKILAQGLCATPSADDAPDVCRMGLLFTNAPQTLAAGYTQLLDDISGLILPLRHEQRQECLANSSREPLRNYQTNERLSVVESIVRGIVVESRTWKWFQISSGPLRR